jgi:hypothetical protein
MNYLEFCQKDLFFSVNSFISIWTYRFLFYSLGCNSPMFCCISCSNFGHWKFFLLIPMFQCMFLSESLFSFWYYKIL